MPNLELEQIVTFQIKDILEAHGAHLDTAERITALRKERIGRPIHAVVTTETNRRREWQVGIVIPVSYDGTMHGVLLANDRLFFVNTQWGNEAEDEYKRAMSPNKDPLYFQLPYPYDIDHIERLFEKDLLKDFHVSFLKSMDASEDLSMLGWATDIAREAKIKSV